MYHEGGLFNRSHRQGFSGYRQSPWAKALSLDEFCEYILPHRLGNEPLEPWMAMYQKAFKSVADTMYNRKVDELHEVISWTWSCGAQILYTFVCARSKAFIFVRDKSGGMSGLYGIGKVHL